MSVSDVDAATLRELTRQFAQTGLEVQSPASGPSGDLRKCAAAAFQICACDGRIAGHEP